MVVAHVMPCRVILPDISVLSLKKVITWITGLFFECWGCLDKMNDTEQPQGIENASTGKDQEQMSRDMTNPTKWLCVQRRLRSAWASAQFDQRLRCLHEEALGPPLPSERTAKTLIRLGGCPDWSEPSLDANSFDWFCHVVAQLSSTQNGEQYKHQGIHQMSLVTRKPVFGVFDQVRLNPVCSATETSYTQAGERCHEIMVYFVLRKLILQTHKRSHLLGLDVWVWTEPSSSPLRTAKCLYHYHMCWLKYAPRHEKTCLLDLRPGKTQTGLLSYRD